MEKEQLLESDYENNCSYSDPDGMLVSFAQRSGSYTMAYQHFHNFYEVYYLLGGSRYYFIKNNTYYVKAGDLVLVDKRELHRTLETMEKFQPDFCRGRTPEAIFGSLVLRPEVQVNITALGAGAQASA